jgi:NAD(P)-dependent dehydrogenase (short-subunit alcohol dehydrogenase family)
MDTSGQNALITGVSRRAGIGFAIARRLGESSGRVFVQGWTPHDAEQEWGAEPGGTEAVATELGVPFLEADFADSTRAASHCGATATPLCRSPALERRSFAGPSALRLPLRSPQRLRCGRRPA